MNIGPLKFCSSMMKPSKGYCVLAWHRKPWWSWAIWWYPVTVPRWKFGYWRRGAILSIGRMGYFQFQHQL